MKITPEHFSYIKARIKEGIGLSGLRAYRAALTLEKAIEPRMDVEKRLRWDACYAAVGSRWICDNIYQYADDTHLDTALRRVAEEIEKEEADAP